MYNRIAGYKQYYKSLVMLGVPIIIGQLGAIITGLADTIMVGQHSTEELAAASFVNNVINAFIIMGTGFSYNLTPLIGQNLAMNKKIVIGGWLKNSLVANMTTTLLLIAVLLGIYLNLDSLGQPEELLPLIRPYFAVSLVSILFVMLYNSFRQFVEGIANPEQIAVLQATDSRIHMDIVADHPMHHRQVLSNEFLLLFRQTGHLLTSRQAAACPAAGGAEACLQRRTTSSHIHSENWPI